MKEGVQNGRGRGMYIQRVGGGEGRAVSQVNPRVPERGVMPTRKHVIKSVAYIVISSSM